jgi:hypothetical protein
MARKASELAEIAAATLRMARDEVIAAGDPEAIAWATDQFRKVEEMLRRVMAYGDAPSADVKRATDAA